jgi:hypothetical protein
MSSSSAAERGRLGAAKRWERARERQQAAAVEGDHPSLSEPNAEGIERELTVIRVGPNPRTVTCEYWELSSRRTCVVNVGRNNRYLPKMKFKMCEPVSEDQYSKPWVYRGKAPRRKGRW